MFRKSYFAGLMELVDIRALDTRAFSVGVRVSYPAIIFWVDSLVWLKHKPVKLATAGSNPAQPVLKKESWLRSSHLLKSGEASEPKY